MLGNASICAWLGLGLAWSSAAMAMMKPGSQKPHWLTCSAAHACWTGWARSLDRPSMVVMSLPSSAAMVNVQLVAARPSTITVHAPQVPAAQLEVAPVRLDESRSAHNKGDEGSNQ